MRYLGLAYRAHNPNWAFTPTSGEGAKRHGGRFNPVGVSALYLALTETTALAEYNQGFPHRPQPSTLCAYDVDCTDILDLTDASNRKTVGITQSDLACAWESMANLKQTPPTWTVAIRLIETGYAGLITPSFAKNSPIDGRNIVLWDWSDTPPHQVRLIDDGNKLPKDQSSWQ